MRVFKRMISFGLAAVLLTGLLTVGVGAVKQAFIDGDQIRHQTAVELLVELGVIAGKGDGRYDPTGTLTRAEAAKLVCVILNGGRTPSLPNPNQLSYQDTKGSWAAPYIEYVTERSIVAGDGQGYFRPDDTVTGCQLAKMLLVAIGYDAIAEGMVGNRWNQKTDTLANQKGLYEALPAFIPDAPLNRDDAARMVYNALFVHMVQYPYDGAGLGLPAEPIEATILSQCFSIDAVSGVVGANEMGSVQNGGTVSRAGTSVIDIRTVNGIAGSGLLTLPEALENDWLGQEVTVLLQHRGTAAQRVLGRVEPTARNKVAATWDGLTTEAKASLFLQSNGISLGSAALIRDGVYERQAQIQDLYDSRTGLAGIQRKLVDNNGDGIAEYLFVASDLLTVVERIDASNKTITCSGVPALGLERVNAYEGIAVGDVVLMRRFGTKVTLERPKTLTGAPSALNLKTSSPTINGRAYDFSAVRNCTGMHNVPRLNLTSVFYLDDADHIIAVGVPLETEASYALVTASNASSNLLDEAIGVVRLAAEDGSIKTCMVDLEASAERFGAVADTTPQEKISYMVGLLSNGRDATNMAGQIVTFALNANGTVILSPTQANGMQHIAPISATSANSAYTVDGKQVLAGDATVYFCWGDDGSVGVIKGNRNLPSSSSNLVAGVAYTEAPQAVYQADAVVVRGNIPGNTTYVYVLEAVTVSLVQGNPRYTHNMISPGTGAQIRQILCTQRYPSGLYHMIDQNGTAVLSKRDSILEEAIITQVSADGNTLRTSRGTYTLAEDAKAFRVTDPETPVKMSRSELVAGRSVVMAKDSSGQIAAVYLVR